MNFFEMKVETIIAHEFTGTLWAGVKHNVFTMRFVVVALKDVCISTTHAANWTPVP